jgi:protein TonB
MLRSTVCLALFIVALQASPAVQRSNPDSRGQFHGGDGVSAPMLIFGPTPELTDEATRKNVKGTVVVSLTVDIAGEPQDVRISRSLAEDLSKKLRSMALDCDEKVIEAVKKYRFKPAEFQGKPVPVETTIGIFRKSAASF